MAEAEEKIEDRSLFTRHENFESWYTNNIQFYPTDWDLKLIFGELDWPPEAKGNLIVQQHTGMSMSWRQAKILHYFLALQIEFHEMQSGKIEIPAGIMPPEPEPPSAELASNSEAVRFYEFAKKARENLVASSTR